MKRIALIGTLLLVSVLTAGGTASAGVVLPPGWPFLPPVITSDPPPAYYPDTYGYYSYPNVYSYYSYPYRYYGYRGPGHWGYGGRGYHGYQGHGGGGHGYQGHSGYRR